MSDTLRAAQQQWAHAVAFRLCNDVDMSLLAKFEKIILAALAESAPISEAPTCDTSRRLQEKLDLNENDHLKVFAALRNACVLARRTVAHPNKAGEFATHIIRICEQAGVEAPSLLRDAPTPAPQTCANCGWAKGLHIHRKELRELGMCATFAPHSTNGDKK
jgi:hypothetical protein